MAKKYVWLKLKEDFFQQRTIKKLRKIAGGDTYTIIYLKLQLLSLTDEGKLFYEGVEDTFAEEMALAIDEDVENVKVTLMFLEKNGLIQTLDADEFTLPEVINSIGTETAAAERKRQQRIREKEKKLLGCDNVTPASQLVTISHTEKEEEKEIDKETTTKIDILNKIEENPDLEDEKDSSSFFEDLEKEKIRQIKLALQSHGISIPTCKNIMDLVYSKQITLEKIKEVLTVAPLKKWQEGAIFEALKNNWQTDLKTTEKEIISTKDNLALKKSYEAAEEKERLLKEKEELDKFFNTLPGHIQKSIEGESLIIAKENYDISIAPTMARNKVKYDLIKEHLKKQKGA